MRAILHSDIAALARVLAAQRGARHDADILRYLDQAHAADKYRKRYRRAHPIWGNGALFGRMMRLETGFRGKGDFEQARRIIGLWRARGL